MHPNTVIKRKDTEDKSSKVAKYTAPVDLVEFRQRLLEKAGISEDSLADTLRKTYTRLNELLDATTTTRTTYQGEVTAEHVDRDNRAILKAIELFMAQFGVGVSRANTPEPNAATNITVVVQNWFDEEPATVIDVTPVQ